MIQARYYLGLFLLLCLLVDASAESLRSASKFVQKKPPKLAAFPLLPGDSPEARRRRRNRRRQLAEDDENENPMVLQRDRLYEGYGVHYVDLWVGCPPQRVTVIVDTGSSVTGFPCSGCQHCGGDEESHYHTDALFQQENSTCFEIVTSNEECLVGNWHPELKQCMASKHYSEGSSWEAFEATDIVYSGGDHFAVDVSREEKDSFRLHFGCQDKMTGLFETQLADGIMGLYNSQASFWSQAYAEKAIETQMFSLCFSEPNHVERTGTPAGAMVLGGTDTRLHKTQMVYAQQMSTDGGKYVLHLDKVYLRQASGEEAAPLQVEDLHKVVIFEEDLNNGPAGVILDSGTTGTYLTSQLQLRFVNTFNEMVPEDIMVWGAQKKYPLTLRQIQQLPTIVFQMTAWKDEDDKDENDFSSTTSVPGIVGEDLDPRHAGKSVLVAMEPLHYLVRMEDDDEILDPNDLDELAHYQITVFFDKKKNHGGVLGANFMKGQDTLFDIDNNRIGFAESDCEYGVLEDDEDSS